MNESDEIRAFVARRYVQPARDRAGTTIRIRSGDVVTGMGIKNKAPNVCAVLRSSRFQQQYGLELISEQGRASGMSTAVVFIYRILNSSNPTERTFKSIRGIAKDVFESLGGGEEFIRQQRK